jgi:cytochrome c oxidase assembly protein subunit 15
MTSLTSTPRPVLASESQALTWLHRYILGMAVLTLCLMALGSATRVMNAGLSCPDWPLCYGELVPRQQMNLQVFLEWFHRLVASLLGLMSIALCGVCVWLRQQLPRWLVLGSWLALALVVFQGVLGGLTVIQLLRFDIVTAHLGTGLLFFSTLLVMGTALVPYQAQGTVGRLPWFGLAAVALVYGQSILGGLVASRWALHQCLGASQLCSVMHSHIAGIFPATLATLILGWVSWRTVGLSPILRQFATLVIGLVGLQILLGVATFRLHLQVEPLTVAHQATGAALLGTLVVFTVLAWRDRHPRQLT